LLQPNPFEVPKQPSNMTLQQERGPDHGEAQKRPQTKSKHGRPTEARKIVGPYASRQDPDYIGHNRVL
jgi:hypothetical protein